MDAVVCKEAFEAAGHECVTIPDYLRTSGVHQESALRSAEGCDVLFGFETCGDEILLAHVDRLRKAAHPQ
mgnify:CR=1 FL=1